MLIARNTYPFTEGLQDVIDLNAQVVGSDGMPLENAHVSVAGQNTTTNMRGIFQLNDVPYTATVTVSWQASAVQIEAYRIGNTITIEANALDEVVITSKPKSKTWLYVTGALFVGLVAYAALTTDSPKPKKITL